jgi:predicted branched-subunit amino acid permease
MSPVAVDAPHVAPTPTLRRTALNGASAMTPMVIGLVPFALAIGATIDANSVSPFLGIISAATILAGAAQLTAVEMLANGSAPLVIVASALLINVRFLLYSAALAPWFADQPLRRRLIVALAVIDQTHLVCIPRFQRDDLNREHRLAYYAGAAIWLCTAWIAAQTIAIAIGGRIPDVIPLELAAPLAMAGLLAKTVQGRPAVSAAVVGGGVAILAAGAPLHSTLLLALIAGIIAGGATPTTEEQTS